MRTLANVVVRAAVNVVVNVVVMAVLATTVSGCAYYQMAHMQFDTHEPETAMNRAISALNDNCAGISLVNEQHHIVLSRWKEWREDKTVFLTRCTVMVMPHEKAESKVRLSFSAKVCEPGMMGNPDVMASQCADANEIPNAVQNQLYLVAVAFEKTVRR